MRGLLGAIVAVLLAALVLAPAAGAVVPPKRCGTMTVKSTRYLIKADQMRCKTAMSHARRYLRSHKRPSGYSCRNYSGGTALKFRCSKRIKVFFAIRR